MIAYLLIFISLISCPPIKTMWWAPQSAETSFAHNQNINQQCLIPISNHTISALTNEFREVSSNTVPTTDNIKTNTIKTNSTNVDNLAALNSLIQQINSNAQAAHNNYNILINQAPPIFTNNNPLNSSYFGLSINGRLATGTSRAPIQANISFHQIPREEVARFKNWQYYNQTIQHEPNKQEFIYLDLQKLNLFIEILGTNPTLFEIKDQMRLGDLQQLFRDCFPHLEPFVVFYEKEIFILNKFQELAFPGGEFRSISTPKQIQEAANIYSDYLKQVHPREYLKTLESLAQHYPYFKTIYSEAIRSKNPLEYISMPFKAFGRDIIEIWHENYNYLKTLPRNSFNSEVAEFNDFLIKRDFAQAKQILNAYALLTKSEHVRDHKKNIERYEELKSIYQQAYSKEFNEHGINRYFAAIDPYYSQIKAAIAQGKLECQQHSTTAEQLNAQLLQRYNEAKQMIAFGNGSQSDPKNLQIAYAMIDNKDNLDLMIDYLARFSKDSAASEDRSTFQAFCTDAGLPRYLLKQNGGLVDGMQLPAALGLEANAELRSIACKALVTDASTPEAQKNIAKTLDYIREACSNTPLAKDYGILARTLFHEYKHENTPRIVSELTHLASKTPLIEQQELKDAIIPRITEKIERFSHTVDVEQRSILLADIHDLNKAYVLMSEQNFSEAQKLIEEVDNPSLRLQHMIDEQRVTQDYSLTPNATILLQHYKIDPQTLKTFTGSPIQQSVHAEVVKVLNHSARLQSYQKDIPALKNISQTSFKLGLLANNLNAKQDFIRSTSILNFCNNVLKIGDIVQDGLKGVFLGTVDAVQTTANRFYNFPTNFTNTVYNTGHLLYNYKTTIPNGLDALYNSAETFTSLCGLVIPPDYSFFESDPQYIEMYHRITQTQSENLDATLHLALETIKQQTVQDITRAITHNVADGIINTMVFKGIGITAQAAKNTSYFTEFVHQINSAKAHVTPQVRDVLEKVRDFGLQKKPGFLHLTSPIKNSKLCQPKFSPGNDLAHYTKHKLDLLNAFKINNYSFQQYIDDAIHIIETGTYIPERHAYIKLIGGKNINFGFVGLDRVTGEITTFHVKTLSELKRIAPSLIFEPK